MKHPVLFGFFYIAAPLLIILRVFQQLAFVDQSNGFFKPAFSAIGICVSIACVLLFATVLILAIIKRRLPPALPNKSIAMGIACVIASGLLLLSALLEAFSSSVLVGLLAVIAAVALAIYAFGVITGANFGKFGLILVPIYALIRLLNEFTSYRGEVTVPYTMFEVLTMVFIVLFTLSFAKTVHGIQSKGGTVMFYVSSMMCCFLSLSQWLIPVLSRLLSVSLHGNPSIEFSYFSFFVLSLAAVHAADRRRV